MFSQIVNIVCIITVTVYCFHVHSGSDDELDQQSNRYEKSRKKTKYNKKSINSEMEAKHFFSVPDDIILLLSYGITRQKCQPELTEEAKEILNTCYPDFLNSKDETLEQIVDRCVERGVEFYQPLARLMRKYTDSEFIVKGGSYQRRKAYSVVAINRERYEAEYFHVQTDDGSCMIFDQDCDKKEIFEFLDCLRGLIYEKNMSSEDVRTILREIIPHAVEKKMPNLIDINKKCKSLFPESSNAMNEDSS